MLASEQLAVSGQTEPCGHRQGFFLTKVSKQGIQYFYTGEHTEVETQSGEEAFVAETSLFVGDALFFCEHFNARSMAAGLNFCGIGGAEWVATPVTKLAGEWVRGQ